MTTLLIILLAAALGVAVGYIARMRRNLLDSQDLSAALIADNERLSQKNSELVLENEHHLVSLNMVLAEMER